MMLQRGYEIFTKHLTKETFSVTIMFDSAHTIDLKGDVSVKRGLRRILRLILTLLLMIGLANTALAASAQFQTTAGVNLRSGPTVDSGIVRAVGVGANVEMIEHDPAGWSNVKVNGTVGYIRSDFLKFPTGSAPVTFKTTDGVNFRSGPSTDSTVIRALGVGTSVAVLEHDPAGWSKAKIDDKTGYIRSDFLAWSNNHSSQQSASTPAAAAAAAPPQSTMFYRTTTGVNFRTGPSTESSVIRLLDPGVIVGMLEYSPGGWSKVSVDQTVGYVKTEFLRVVGDGVELLEWSAAKDIVPKGVPIRVVDVRTGVSYNIKCFSKGKHADVEPITKADTDAIFESRNGVWAWDPRPVWVTIGERTIAASLNGKPHAGSTISGNGMNGHLCLHFNGTVTNSKTYQRDLNNAVMEAFNASR